MPLNGFPGSGQGDGPHHDHADAEGDQAPRRSNLQGQDPLRHSQGTQLYYFVFIIVYLILAPNFVYNYLF